MTTRTCTRCGIEKVLTTSFYPTNDPSRGTYRHVCAACVRARAHRRRQAKLEEERARDRERGDRSPRDQRRAARIAVSTARRSGELEAQPCEVCGNETVDAHHDDYTKPLDVRWLCRVHHAEHHRKYA